MTADATFAARAPFKEEPGRSVTPVFVAEPVTVVLPTRDFVRVELSSLVGALSLLFPRAVYAPSRPVAFTPRRLLAVLLTAEPYLDVAVCGRSDKPSLDEEFSLLRPGVVGSAG